CPWVGKPWPGCTRSSLITRRVRNPHVARIVVFAERKRVRGVEPAEVEMAAVGRGAPRDHSWVPVWPASLIRRSRSSSGATYFSLEVLHDVVVGAGTQSGDDVLRPRLRGDEDQIGLRLAAQRADLRAELEAVHPRHRPVEDRQRRRIVLLEELPRLLAAG